MILGSMTNTLVSSIRLIISYVLRMQSKFIFHFPATVVSKNYETRMISFSHSIQMGMCLSNFNIFLYEYITIQAQRQTWIFECIKKLLTIPGREASLSITITSIFAEFIVTFEYHHGEYFLEILSNKTFISFNILFLRMILLILEIEINKNVLLSWKDH